MCSVSPADKLLKYWLIYDNFKPPWRICCIFPHNVSLFLLLICLNSWTARRSLHGHLNNDNTYVSFLCSIYRYQQLWEGTQALQITYCWCQLFSLLCLDLITMWLVCAFSTNQLNIICVLFVLRMYLYRQVSLKFNLWTVKPYLRPTILYLSILLFHSLLRHVTEMILMLMSSKSCCQQEMNLYLFLGK